MADISLLSNPTFEQFEIVKAGIATFPTLSLSNPGAGNYLGGEGQTIIAHNLGYTPPFIGFLQITSVTPIKNYPLPFSFLAGSAATASWEVYQMYCDATNIYLLSDLLVYANARTIGGSDHTLKYYLLRDRVRS